MDYIDFELEIGPGTGRDYPVTVLHSGDSSELCSLLPCSIMRLPKGEEGRAVSLPFLVADEVFAGDVKVSVLLTVSWSK